MEHTSYVCKHCYFPDPCDKITKTLKIGANGYICSAVSPAGTSAWRSVMSSHMKDLRWEKGSRLQTVNVEFEAADIAFLNKMAISAVRLR